MCLSVGYINTTIFFSKGLTQGSIFLRFNAKIIILKHPPFFMLLQDYPYLTPIPLIQQVGTVYRIKPHHNTYTKLGFHYLLYYKYSK